MSQNPETVYLKDYRSSAYLIDRVELAFSLEESATRVVSKLQISLNPDRNGTPEPLVLDGEHLELLGVTLDGCPLEDNEYQVDSVSLTLPKVPETFLLEIETQIDPLNNKALEGLYLSSGNFCTQCEAQGFRRITYYLDRPDVLSRFKVRIEADKAYPILLSNGNLLEQGDLDGTRHFAVWEDPFRKPSYLFALVAGSLVCQEDHYTTMSGRDVLLQIYVEERNQRYCDHAMASLKKSMQWDEQVYGLEYDLDRYMIVAVDDFNMGAMENKGLNVFNSKYVLAHPETATDQDFLGVESVIGHEYFHNWTGNRVTCRDWFQLSLKEGLTVFRDQEFSADMNSAAVNRIDDVRILRQFQFPEDAGPMAHPVRPASYVEINNFYTTTVYNKGAEVIRMMQTLLGRDAFIRGVQLYLERHDGEAATCDDFVLAMEEAGGVDLTTFKRWYSQSGTPEIAIEQDYSSEEGSLSLTVSQCCPETPGQTNKQLFHIPVVIGLLGRDGSHLSASPASANVTPCDSGFVLQLTQERERFDFSNVNEAPVLSPLRGFSAPVKLTSRFSDEDLALRMAHDSDDFNRWEAGQMLATQELLRLYHEGTTDLTPGFVDAWGTALADQDADSSLLSQLLTLPSEQFLSDQLDAYDPGVIRSVRGAAKQQLAERYSDELLKRYQDCCAGDPEYLLTPLAVGQRSLKNFCLHMLMTLDSGQSQDLAIGQYHGATNMTDRLAALASVVDSDSAERDALLADFHAQWKDHPLLLDKWFILQASAHREGAFEAIERLLDHPDFTLANPNRVRSLLGGLCQNPGVFHRVDGKGYRLLVDQIVKIDQNNPQLAARLASPLTRWKRLEPVRRQKLKDELLLLQGGTLSKDLYEIINKSLA